MDDHDQARIRSAFKIICNRCGSDDCVINLDPGTTYGEYSSDPASATLGCNACKENDLQVYA